MKEFRVVLSNRPGELARVATALARQGVSLKAVAATAHSNQVTVHLVGHDVESTRAGLEAAAIPFEEHEVLSVLLEDKAGELAKIAGALADAGVNLNAIYLAGRADDLVEIVVAADDTKKAKKILGESAI
ncbi:MAG: ACT domain-containing protein [Planctomycetota bacterium]